MQDDIIRIDGRTHTCALSGPIDGRIKTVTIKRDAVGDVWVCVACEVESKPNVPMTGKTDKVAGTLAYLDFSQSRDEKAR